MEQEFTTSTWMKLIYGALSMGMLIFSLVLFDTYKPSVGPAILLIPILLIIGSILIAVNAFRRKIILYDDGILLVNLFSTKEVAVADIKGCRIGEKIIYLEFTSNDTPKIAIRSYIDLSNSDELVKWLKEHFEDLDAVALKNEKDQLLHDSALGFTEQDRNEKLVKIKWISLSYNLLGMIIGLGSILIDNKVGTLILLIYPLLGIIVMVTSQGLIKFLSNSKRSVYGFIMLGFLLPSFILLIKSLFTYDLSEYNNLWFPSLVTSVILLSLLYTIGINRSVESVTGQVIIMVIASSLYGFGSTRQVNCEFDKSTPKVIHATIDSKWIEYNKGTHHHLKIVSWDSNPKPKDIEVSKSTYDQYSTGNRIEVYFKNGLLNIPWYYIN